jgi:hypothetical protein
VQTLLGTTLPKQANDLHYFRWQPSRDLTYYTTFIKFSTSRAEFIDLMEQMSMNFHNMGRDASLHLPTAWETPSGLELDWWDPGSDTPADSAAKSFGTNGWIVAKYERGNVYLIATDTGHTEGAPGPW